MATPKGRNRCFRCRKDRATLRCGGCLQEFCFNHSADHRQELNKQLDEVEVTHNLFHQSLTEQTTDPQKHAFIEQIDKWEHDSVQKIRQIAEEARQTILKHATEHIKQIEVDLNKLTEQLRQNREENDFYETDLRHWNEELMRLSKEVTTPSNMILREDTTSSLINKISVDITTTSVCPAKIVAMPKWIQKGIAVAGGNGRGNALNQLNCPIALCVDNDQTIYVADHFNHRILEWKSGATSGKVVAGGNEQGNRNDQLNSPTDVVVDNETDSLTICDYGNQRVVRWPRQNGTIGETLISNIGCWGLAMDNDGYLYVSDIENHEVRRWTRGDPNGVVVAGGNGAGNRLDQLIQPNCIFVDQDYSVYVSDIGNHRVMKWMKGAKQGIVVAGGQGPGIGLTLLYDPRGLVVDQPGTVYVADCVNHRIMRWVKGATQGTVVVGGNGEGGQANQFCKPCGVSLDREGNLYVADCGNHRVQKFNIELSSNP